MLQSQELNLRLDDAAKTEIAANMMDTARTRPRSTATSRPPPDSFQVKDDVDSGEG